ncbi:MAG: hypothetical protein ACI4OS_07125 [Akkermansia sp.]
MTIIQNLKGKCFEADILQLKSGEFAVRYYIRVAADAQRKLKPTRREIPASLRRFARIEDARQSASNYAINNNVSALSPR